MIPVGDVSLRLVWIIATTAVLLFRLMTFWLPVVPGWIAYSYMTRRGEL